MLKSNHYWNGSAVTILEQLCPFLEHLIAALLHKNLIVSRIIRRKYNSSSMTGNVLPFIEIYLFDYEQSSSWLLKLGVSHIFYKIIFSSDIQLLYKHNQQKQQQQILCVFQGKSTYKHTCHYHTWIFLAEPVVICRG